MKNKNKLHINFSKVSGALHIVRAMVKTLPFLDFSAIEDAYRLCALKILLNSFQKSFKDSNYLQLIQRSKVSDCSIM